MSESIEYEIAREVGPKDSGEIYDYVVRRGPISYDEICRNTGWISPDDIFSCLDALRTANLVEKIQGDLDEHGTTAELWATTDTDASRTEMGGNDAN